MSWPESHSPEYILLIWESQAISVEERIKVYYLYGLPHYGGANFVQERTENTLLKPSDELDFAGIPAQSGYIEFYIY